MFIKAGNYRICVYTALFVCATCLLCTEAKKTNREKKYGCVVPEEPTFGFIVFNDKKKSFKYECFDRYYLNTIRKQKPRRCRHGRWSGNPLICEYFEPSKPLCPKLNHPENGKVIVEGYEAGKQSVFLCNQGYHIEGSKKITCQGGRYWDGIFPICKSHKTALDVAMNFKDKVVHTLSASTAQSEDGVQARLSAGKNGLDILLLLDTSSSIGKKSLAIAKGFMCRLVDIFGVSEDEKGGGNGTRFGLVTFSSDTEDVFLFSDKTARSKNQVKQLINGVQNTGGGTNLVEALSDAANQIIGSKRTSATKAVFIITDAEDATKDVMSKRRRNIIKDMTAVIQNNAEIFAIGVGKTVDKTLIAEIASNPYYEHVFYLEKFEDLSYIGDVISEQNIDYAQCGVSGDTASSQGPHTSKKGALPWLGWLTVFAQDGTSWTCGGALLCDRWFMTTASCVSSLDSNDTVVVADPNQIYLTLGDAKLYKNDETEISPVIYDVRVHQNYTGKKIANTTVREYDIALLDLGENETNRPVLQKYLRPLCFPSDNESITVADTMLESMMAFPDTHRGYTAGWGHAPDNFHYTDMVFQELKQMEQRLTKGKICEKMYPDLDADKFFCVGLGYATPEVCKGDIGGPYMVKMQNKLFSGLGLALHTRNCHELQEFSVFLNILHPSITEWVIPILDGCNRYQPLPKPTLNPNNKAKINYCDTK